jgi:hypothetical protein
MVECACWVASISCGACLLCSVQVPVAEHAPPVAAQKQPLSAHTAPEPRYPSRASSRANITHGWLPRRGPLNSHIPAHSFHSHAPSTCSSLLHSHTHSDPLPPLSLSHSPSTFTLVALSMPSTLTLPPLSLSFYSYTPSILTLPPFSHSLQSYSHGSYRRRQRRQRAVAVSVGVAAAAATVEVRAVVTSLIAEVVERF